MGNKNTAPSTSTTYCRHIKADQSRCRANARHNSIYCFFHDPDSVSEREAARRNGGRERSRRAAVLPGNTPDEHLDSAADVTRLLAQTINQVRRGELDPRISNAVGYLASILLQARERDELEQRVRRLESVLGQRENSNSHFESERDSESLEFVNPGSGGQA
jgi:hypothetical protein